MSRILQALRAIEEKSPALGATAGLPSSVFLSGKATDTLPDFEYFEVSDAEVFVGQAPACHDHQLADPEPTGAPALLEKPAVAHEGDTASPPSTFISDDEELIRLQQPAELSADFAFDELSTDDLLERISDLIQAGADGEGPLRGVFEQAPELNLAEASRAEAQPQELATYPLPGVPASPTPEASAVTGAGQTLPVARLEYQELADQILSERRGQQCQTMLFAASEPISKAHFSAAELAVALVGLNLGRVLVVSCSERSPAVSLLVQDSATGLGDLLTGQVRWGQIVRPTVSPSVGLVNLCGPAWPTATAKTLFDWQEVPQQFAFVVVDATESLAAADLFARHCQGTYLVVQIHETRRRTAQTTKSRLQAAGALMLGCVVSGTAHH